MATAREFRFPSPFDVSPPPGAEGWRDLYPYYVLFSEDLLKNYGSNLGFGYGGRLTAAWLDR